MLDQEDEGTRIGVWVALGVVFFVLVGVIGGVIMRPFKGHGDAAAMAATAPSAAVVQGEGQGDGHGAMGALAGAAGALTAAAADAASSAANAVGDATASVEAAAAAAQAAAAAAAEKLIDAPLTGDLRGTVLFAVGSSALSDEGLAIARDVAQKLGGSGRLVLSGFHDATGDPARNAELAKQRAMSVAAALLTAGVQADRVQLRKPESTTGDGSHAEARRVEIRLVD